MERKTEDGSQDVDRRISIRWKVLQVLGGFLIALGLFFDWPPPEEANLPDTKSFLVVLGGLIGAAGVFAARRQE